LAGACAVEDSGRSGGEARRREWAFLGPLVGGACQERPSDTIHASDPGFSRHGVKDMSHRPFATTTDAGLLYWIKFASRGGEKLGCQFISPVQSMDWNYEYQDASTQNLFLKDQKNDVSSSLSLFFNLCFI
jgi:hypothetical protein